MDAFLGGGVRPPVAKARKAEDARRERLPWVEKHRPRKVSELAYQDEVVAVLRKCLAGADLPNLLFYGPPGTGKTSAILAMARELFGGEYYRDRVLELNASDERGIAVVREKVKKFAAGTAPARLPDGRPCLPLRLVILDEADSITGPAQAALRRTMERMSKYTRFCLICNYVSRIIDPITSRCAKFRFKALAPPVQKVKLLEIAALEGVRVTVEALVALVEASEGDLRRSITALQAGQRLVGEGAQLGLAELEPLTGTVPTAEVEALLTAGRSGSYEAVLAGVEAVTAKGWPAIQLVAQLTDLLLADELLPERAKARILHRLGLVESRLLNGADEFLQLLDLLSLISTMYSAQQ
jgi:replication factor C subunit 2/4